MKLRDLLKDGQRRDRQVMMMREVVWRFEDIRNENMSRPAYERIINVTSAGLAHAFFKSDFEQKLVRDVADHVSVTAYLKRRRRRNESLDFSPLYWGRPEDSGAGAEASSTSEG